MINWGLRFGESLPIDPNEKPQAQPESLDKKKSAIYRKLMDYLVKLEKNKFGLSDRNLNPSYEYTKAELCKALELDRTEENYTLLLETLALTNLNMENKRKHPAESHLNDEGVGYNVYNTAVPSFQYIEDEARGKILDIRFRIDPKYIEQVVDGTISDELDDIGKSIHPDELTGSIIEPEK
jgi:hypothetical protein